jgi:hypothetical protein
MIALGFVLLIVHFQNFETKNKFDVTVPVFKYG